MTSEADLVAEFLARGGRVQVCPPRTFARDATESMGLRDANVQAEKARIAARQRKFERAARKRARAENTGGGGFSPKVIVQPQPQIAAQPVPDVYLPAERSAKPPPPPATRRSIDGKSATAAPGRGETLPPAKPAKPRMPRNTMRPIYEAMVGEGMTVRQMAERLGVTYQTVKDALRRYGLKATRERPVPKGGADAYRAAVAEGLTARQMSARFGVTVRSVHTQLSRHGLKVGHQVKYDPNQDQRVAELHAKGMLDQPIADALGISRTAVRSARARLGLSPNEKKPDKLSQTTLRERARGAIKRGARIVQAEPGDNLAAICGTGWTVVLVYGGKK